MTRWAKFPFYGHDILYPFGDGHVEAASLVRFCRLPMQLSGRTRRTRSKHHSLLLLGKLRLMRLDK